MEAKPKKRKKETRSWRVRAVKALSNIENPSPLPIEETMSKSIYTPGSPIFVPDRWRWAMAEFGLAIARANAAAPGSPM